MNLAELRTRVETRAQDAGNRVFSGPEIDGYINDAYMDVAAARYDWPFMETRRTQVTVAAGATFTALPADVWHVAAVFNATDGAPMDPIDGRNQARRIFPEPGSGAPTLYRVLGANLEVFPAPAVATTIELDAFAPPAELTGTAEPAFPRQHHRILVSGALSFLYEDDGNGEAAAGHRARFEQGIRRLEMDLFAPRSEGYSLIVDTGI